MLPWVEEAQRKARIAKRSAELVALFDELARVEQSPEKLNSTASFGGASLEYSDRDSKAKTFGSTVMITSDGKAIFLSSESRSMPPAFTNFKRIVHTTEKQLSAVADTVTELQNAFSFVADLQLPTETLLALEDGHKEYRSMLTRSRPATFGKNLGSAKAAKNPEKEEEWNMKVLRARAAAADEGYEENQSVEDYAVADLNSAVERPPGLEELIEEIGNEIVKLGESGERLIQWERASDLQWWSSAERTRLIKVSAVRANYHARVAFKWSVLCRHQFFQQVSYLNSHSRKCRDELVKLREQLVAFESRTLETQKVLLQVTTDMELLSTKFQEGADRRAKLQEEMKEKARELQIAPPDCDSVNAELALLIKSYIWPPELQLDAERVLQWIRMENCALE